MSRTVILLTGDRGIGKSTVCRRVAGIARGHGFSCAGIISVALFNGERERVGFAAEDVSDGRRWVVGHLIKKLRGPRYGPYRFSISGFKRASRRSRKALKKECDLFILDEIGPLEMEMGGGFRTILSALFKSTELNLLLVVRPALLEAVLKLFSENRFEARIKVVSVDVENRERLPELIFNDFSEDTL